MSKTLYSYCGEMFTENEIHKAMDEWIVYPDKIVKISGVDDRVYNYVIKLREEDIIKLLNYEG